MVGLRMAWPLAELSEAGQRLFSMRWRAIQSNNCHLTAENAMQEHAKSEHANHHFVPLAYFRSFTGGDPRIHLLHKPTDRIIFKAPIKGQCATHRLYGGSDVAFELEARHGRAIKDAIHAAWNPFGARLDVERVYHLMQFALVQRFRTMHAVRKFSALVGSLELEVFKEYLRCAPSTPRRERMVMAIEKGQFRFNASPTRIVSELLLLALDGVVLITDLAVRILRNRSGVPFLFGDAPVVFCNSYYRNVTSRGVLGLETPGLQIIVPLDSHTLLMLLDGNVYAGSYKAHPVVDLTERCDVSQLNALQLHQSLNSVYFADERDAAYVEGMWHAHKPSVVQPSAQFRERTDLPFDGKPLHGFDPHLNFRLSLSFVECDPINEADYNFSRRTPELVEEYNRRSAERNEEIRRLRRCRKRATDTA